MRDRLPSISAFKQSCSRGAIPSVVIVTQTRSLENGIIQVVDGRCRDAKTASTAPKSLKHLSLLQKLQRAARFPRSVAPCGERVQARTKGYFARRTITDWTGQRKPFLGSEMRTSPTLEHAAHDKVTLGPRGIATITSRSKNVSAEASWNRLIFRLAVYSQRVRIE